MLLAVVMVPSFLLLAIDANQHRIDVMQAAREKALTLAELGAAHENDVIEEVQDVFRVLNRVPEVAAGADPACRAILASVVGDHPQIVFLGTANPSGKIVCSSVPAAIGSDVSQWPAFKHVMMPQGPGFSFGHAQPMPGSPRQQALVAVAPMARSANGAATGVFLAGIDLGWLDKLTAQVAGDPQDRIAMIDPDTSIVLVSRPALPMSSGDSAAKYPALAAFQRNHSDGVVEGRGPDARTCIYGYASMQPAVSTDPHPPAILTVGLLRDKIVGRTIRHMIISLVLAAFVIGAAIFTVGWLAEVRLLRPMRSLTATASRLSGGNLDSRVDLSRIPMKEMRVLGTAFNTMAQALQHLALIDGLTGIANRRQFDLALHNEVQRANRMRRTLSLLMIDADHFKSFNDRFGHVAGDACLRRIAETLQAVGKRETDLVARYGGEEFVILLPDTDQASAFALAYGLLNAVRGLAIPLPESSRGIVTISIGIVTLIAPPDIVAHAMIESADQALYAAKVAGRDGIVVSDGRSPIG